MALNFQNSESIPGSLLVADQSGTTTEQPVINFAVIKAVAA